MQRVRGASAPPRWTQEANVTYLGLRHALEARKRPHEVAEGSDMVRRWCMRPQVAGRIWKSVTEGQGNLTANILRKDPA